MDFIDRFRRKSRSTKNHYAVLGAFVITGIIASFWTFSLPARLDKITKSTSEPVTDGPNTLGGFLDTVGKQVGSAVESISGSTAEDAASEPEETVMEQPTLDSEEVDQLPVDKIVPESMPVVPTSTTIEETVHTIEGSNPFARMIKSTSTSSGEVILIGTSTGKIAE